MAKVKSCIVLNPPMTPREQAEYDGTVARLLAKALYRSLSPLDYENYVERLRTYIKQNDNSNTPDNIPALMK